MTPTEVLKLVKSGYWFHYKGRSYAFPMIESCRGEALINGIHISLLDGFSLEVDSAKQPLTMAN